MNIQIYSYQKIIQINIVICSYEKLHTYDTNEYLYRKIFQYPNISHTLISISKQYFCILLQQYSQVDVNDLPAQVDWVNEG